jgi:hypothetical protein
MVSKIRLSELTCVCGETTRPSLFGTRQFIEGMERTICDLCGEPLCYRTTNELFDEDKYFKTAVDLDNKIRMEIFELTDGKFPKELLGKITAHGLSAQRLEEPLSMEGFVPQHFLKERIMTEQKPNETMGEKSNDELWTMIHNSETDETSRAAFLTVMSDRHGFGRLSVVGASQNQGTRPNAGQIVEEISKVTIEVRKIKTFREEAEKLLPATGELTGVERHIVGYFKQALGNLILWYGQWVENKDYSSAINASMALGKLSSATETLRQLGGENINIVADSITDISTECWCQISLASGRIVPF